jgi:VIT1/CCC1 family predicted Fe2+/Mn2+ transporter
MKLEAGIYLKDAVYGGLDGLITTFAMVAGVSGAELSAQVAFVLGMANLLADGLSMAMGNYLGTKSEIEFERRERQREEWEVDTYPQGVLSCAHVCR